MLAPHTLDLTILKIRLNHISVTCVLQNINIHYEGEHTSEHCITTCTNLINYQIA